MEFHTKEVGCICSVCENKRTRSCKPWYVCSCGKIMCGVCVKIMRRVYLNVETGEAKCTECTVIEYERQRLLEESTPIECSRCKDLKLPKDFHSHRIARPICQDCHDKEEAEKENNRKVYSVAGLVEVCYGEHPKPDKDGGSGYAYRDPGLNLQLGDVVFVPATWMDKEIRGDYSNKKATVVSTYSDYKGNVASILGKAE